MELRIFVAHSRSDPDEGINGKVAAVRAAVAAKLDARGSDAQLIVTPGRDDFRARAAEFGGYDSWVADVGAGVDFAGRDRFDAIVCTASIVGLATSKIVDAALVCGRPVYLLDMKWDAEVGVATSVILRVRSIQQVATGDDGGAYQLGLD